MRVVEDRFTLGRMLFLGAKPQKEKGFQKKTTKGVGQKSEVMEVFNFLCIFKQING